MELWLVKVKHIYDNDYDILGIFESEIDVESAKILYLSHKEKCGLKANEFTFSQSKYLLGKVEY